MKTRVMNQITLSIFTIIVSICVIQNVSYAANPSFTEGTSTTRTVAEDAGWNAAIGSAISATDTDNDISLYYLHGANPIPGTSRLNDANWFKMDASTGQLRRSAVLDYEFRKTLYIYVAVRDDDGNEDFIRVTVNVTNVNEPPKFNIHSRYRSIGEQREGPVNLGAPITAVDDAGDTSTYSLGGPDANLFSINSTTGQLSTRPGINFDYETGRRQYQVTVTATDTSDPSLTGSITVTVSVSNNNESPIFPDNFQTSHTLLGPLSAGTTIGNQPDPPSDPDLTPTNTDPNPSRNGHNVLKYRLFNVYPGLFAIDETTGQLSAGKFVQVREEPYKVEVILSDESLTTNKNVFITVMEASTQQVNTQQQNVDNLNTDQSRTPIHFQEHGERGKGQVTVLPPVHTVGGSSGSGSSNLPEDVDEDGDVDNDDLSAVAMHFGDTPTGDLERYDVDGDGDIDTDDFTQVQSKLGSTVNSAPAASLALQLERIKILHGTDSEFEHVIQLLERRLPEPAPRKTVLLTNYPNPFNPETWMPYRLAKAADVTLTIYAASGEVVRSLALGHQPVGNYVDRGRAAYWDGKNALGESVSSGVYFYTLSTDDFSATRKMLVAK